MRARLWLLIPVLAAALLAGCGGDDDGGDDGGGTKTFSDDDIALTFTYPDDFEKGKVSDVGESVGEPVARATVGLDSDNLLVVSKYELNVAVTAANLSEAMAELDGVVARLAGGPVPGTPTEVGGLPAVRYERVALDDPAEGESRFVFVFDDRVEYQLNCQSTPGKRARVYQACDQMLATLRPA